MSTISLVAKEAHFLGYGTGKSHCYLVYENDAGQRFVTSLTDVSEEFFPFFRLRFNVEQINTPYAQAQEIHDLNRAERQLDLSGRDVDAVWSLINQHAQEIKVEKPTYDPLTQNSTSFIASLLNVVGLDLVDNLPGFNGNHPTDSPQPEDYPGLYNLLDFDYRLAGTASDDVIRGAAGNDIFWGGGGDDTLTGKQGSDVLDGGLGIDSATYVGPRLLYGVFWIGGPTVFSNIEGIDRLYNIERLQFADRTEHISDEPLEYIASYTDLMAAFGANAAAGFDHFMRSGYAEGRTIVFNGLEYIASYRDLIQAFGASDDAGASHYIQSGRFEDRSPTFDGLEYIASYGDLINAFHTQVTADPDIGANHYIIAGYFEGRATNLFHAAQYLANYADLQAAFGTDLEAATLHYIANGYVEGRTDHA